MWLWICVRRPCSCYALRANYPSVSVMPVEWHFMWNPVELAGSLAARTATSTRARSNKPAFLPIATPTPLPDSKFQSRDTNLLATITMTSGSGWFGGSLARLGDLAWVVRPQRTFLPTLQTCSGFGIQNCTPRIARSDISFLAAATWQIDQVLLRTQTTIHFQPRQHPTVHQPGW